MQQPQPCPTLPRIMPSRGAGTPSSSIRRSISIPQLKPTLHSNHTAHNLTHNGLNHRTRRFPRNPPSPCLGYQLGRRKRCLCRQPRSRQERSQAGRPQGPRALRTSMMPLRLLRYPERTLRINCIPQCLLQNPSRRHCLQANQTTASTQ